MKIEATNTYWIFNGTLEAIPDLMRGQSVENPVVYEVIRVKNGIPVFLKAHMDRLEKSLQILLKGKESPEWLNKMSEHFNRLMKAEEIVNQNIKIMVWNIGHASCSWCMFPIQSNYPDKKIYEIGVDTEILKSERANPTAKIFHDTLIETVTAMRKETGVFEVLLADRNNCLTEGSRSNLFFVKDNSVYTAPEEDILHGITREKLKKVLLDEDIPCIAQALDLESIDNFDGAFLTGTSIHVLPIHAVGTHVFKSSENKLILKIMDAFEQSIEKDVENV